MTTNGAAWHFRKGQAALNAGKPREAMKHFAEAVAAERKLNVIRPQIRYSSYYWLCHSLVHGASHQAIRGCEGAVSRDSFEPDLRWNLARVYALAGKRTRALATLEQGLRLDPTHRRMKVFLRKLDRRARPLLPRLGRDHPLNRSYGRWRATLGGSNRRGSVN